MIKDGANKVLEVEQDVKNGISKAGDMIIDKTLEATKNGALYKCYEKVQDPEFQQDVKNGFTKAGDMIKDGANKVKEVEQDVKNGISNPEDMMKEFQSMFNEVGQGAAPPP